MYVLFSVSRLVNYLIAHYKAEVALVIRGGCVTANRLVYRKRVKRETYNMPVDFLSYTPCEALICSPCSQNGGASQ
jgi:hypothetical protein